MSQQYYYYTKSDIISYGIYQIYARYRYLEFLYYSNDKELKKYFLPQINEDYYYLLQFISQLAEETVRNCKRLYDARRKKSERLKKRIENLLTENCLFLTMTFTDVVLNNTSDTTRHKYITRFLKQFKVPYIANIDFGSLNEREHYHGIIQLNKIDFSTYIYGNLNVERIYNKNSSALAKYINKLTNHCIKSTTGNARLIYSR